MRFDRSYNLVPLSSVEWIYYVIVAALDFVPGFKATTIGYVGPSAWDTVPTHTYIHITGPVQSMVYTAAYPESACPRAGSPKYPSFFFHQPKGCFPPYRQKVPEFTLKKTFLFLKGYESVNFRLRRARPEIRHPRTCSRSRTYMQHSDPQIHLLWSYYMSPAAAVRRGVLV